MLSIKEINLLEAQNKGLKKQNEDLQKENVMLKGELDAYQMSENEANEIIVELKTKNAELKKQLKKLKGEK